MNETELLQVAHDTALQLLGEALVRERLLQRQLAAAVAERDALADRFTPPPG